MAHRPEIKRRARRLRREEGLTIDQLAARLGVSRSTIYNWVEDLPIPGSGVGGGFSDAARARGTERMRENSRLRRRAAYIEGLELFAFFRDTPAFREFVAAYLAAGSRSDSRTVSFAHSDPAVVRLVHAWLRLLSRNPVRYHLYLAPGLDPAHPRRLWAAHLGVSVERIRCSAHPPGPASRDGGDPAADAEATPASSRAARFGRLRLTASDALLCSELEAVIYCTRAEWPGVPTHGVKTENESL